MMQRLSRRTLVFVLSSMGTLIALSAGAQHAASPQQQLKATPIPDNYVAFAGPFSTLSMSGLPVLAIGSPSGQNGESRPSRTTDQINFRNFEERQLNKTLGVDTPRQ
jgi:hypothetical protein